MAIGDAFGAGREYRPPDEVRKNNDGRTYVQHGKWKDLKPGCYTDDTQMALGVAEAMVRDIWTPMGLAGWFVEAFNRDPRAGYSSAGGNGGFYGFLQKCDDGFDFLDGIRPHSDKSGGAMRAAAIGLLPNSRDVIDRAMWQASLTHGTQHGMDAAAVAALTVHYFRYSKGDKSNLGKWLIDVSKTNYGWNEPFKGKVGAKGWQSTRAAVTAIMAHDTMEDILKACIAFTGDVDTVAAIAMPAACFSSEVEQNLHADLYAGLEQGEFGLDYLKAMDQRLLEKYPLSK